MLWMRRVISHITTFYIDFKFYGDGLQIMKLRILTTTAVWYCHNDSHGMNRDAPTNSVAVVRDE